jgi:hypothetical protein
LSEKVRPEPRAALPRLQREVRQFSLVQNAPEDGVAYDAVLRMGHHQELDPVTPDQIREGVPLPGRRERLGLDNHDRVNIFFAEWANIHALG